MRLSRIGFPATLLFLTTCLAAQAPTPPPGRVAGPFSPLTDTHHFQIIDDPALTSACLAAREVFLAREPQWQRNRPNRLDFTLLVIDPDGTIRRGGHGQENLAYPASCVKLPFMAAAMQWCREQDLPPSALDPAVAPMINVSSNEATGEVVDAITSATNVDDLTTSTDYRFRAWMHQRRYTERFLESRGLLGNQTILHKTYPTNSGRSPSGAERVASALYGGNRMQPRLSASLMLEIAKGVLEPQAHAYMMQQLRHERFEDDSVVGWGLPPGSDFFNKPGVAYDTAEDIAFVRLPNGREFVLAAYSNSWERNQPLPHDANRLGRFTEILLETTGLTAGLTTVYAKATAPTLNMLVSSAPVQLITQTTRTITQVVPVLRGQGTTVPLAQWSIPLPTSGAYELVAFHPAGADLATSAVLTVHHREGETTIPLNQRNGERRPRRLGTFAFGAKPSKTPALSQDERSVTARVTIAAPPGQAVALDAIRAQLWVANPDPAILNRAQPE